MLRAPAILLAALVLLAPFARAEELTRDQFNELKKRAAVAAQAKDSDALAGVVRDLGRDDSQRAVEMIVKVVLMDADMGVYLAAKDALASMGSDDAVEAMVKQVERRSGDGRLKILFIDAFAERDDARTAEALSAALGQQRAPEVLRAAVQAVERRKPEQAVEGLLALHERFEGTPESQGLLMRAVREALLAITGRSFDNAADWRKYWSVAKLDRRVRTGDDDPQMTSERSDQPKPTFFGSEIVSNRLVFVIDVSGSMTAGDRIGRAKQALQETVQALPQGSVFTMVAFSNGCRVWSERLEQADPRTKSRAVEWIQGLQAGGNTMTLTAMKAAFEVQGADAVVLLSDGAPTETDPTTGQPLTTEQVGDEILKHNRWKRWRIDTFGIGASGEFRGFLQGLAERTGGEYTEIP